jgi:AraC-like DNA-binding protein
MNETHTVRLLENNKLGIYSIYFHPEFVNSVFDFKNIRGTHENFRDTELHDLYLLVPFFGYRNGICRLCLTAMENKRIEYLFRNIDAILNGQENRFWPCESRSFFIELLFYVRRLADSATDTGEMLLPEANEETRSILLYLHTNYANRISSCELSRLFNTNKTTLNVRFRKATGYSVRQYLIKLRIDMAAVMIRKTELKISEIMYRVGFRDAAHFYRMFKKITDFSPTRYRKHSDGPV